MQEQQNSPEEFGQMAIKCLREFDDQEPRVLDLDLAEWLGYEQLRQIRELIQRNLEDVGRLGVCRTIRQTSGPSGGAPGTEYWLNEAQALLICTLSRTPRAADVRIGLIQTFLAYRKGRLVPANESALVGQVCSEMRQLSLSIDHLATRMSDRMDRHDEKIGRLETGQRFLTEAVVEIKQSLPMQRKPLSDWSKAIHVNVTASRRNGICPCCQQAPVCNEAGKIQGAEFDHFYARNRNRAEETWLVCGSCNQRLKNSTDFKASVRSAFESYQQALKPFIENRQPNLFQ